MEDISVEVVDEPVETLTVSYDETVELIVESADSIILEVLDEPNDAIEVFFEDGLEIDAIIAAGRKGDTGATGPQGDPGEGVPIGGTAGQILAKIDAVDYNTEWIDNYTSQVKHLVKNASNFTMPKGSVVYISGASGTNMLVSLADADSDATSATTIGFLESELVHNAQGFVVTEGLLAGLDTSTATIGDPVWLSSTPGQVVYGLANKPHAPVHLVYLGTVTRVSSQVGEIFISVNNGWEVGELHDVAISNPTDNQVLTYEQSTGLWKNKLNPADGVTSITAGEGLTGGTVTSTGTFAVQIPTFIQDTQPTTSATKYLWWDTSNGDLTLWIEDGV